MDDSVRYTRSNMASLGAVGVVALPGYYPIWTALFPDSYENLALRMTACVVAVPAMLVDRWPENLERFLSLYWWMGVTYILPFFFTFMLLQNSQSPHANDAMTMVWPLGRVTWVWISRVLFTPGPEEFGSKAVMKRLTERSMLRRR